MELSVGPWPAQRAAEVPALDRARDEYVLVGGGLQNSLIALALLAERPQTRLTLLEREPRLGGNHTWCFHAGDVPEAARAWVEPLVVRRWPAHDVFFPAHRRRLDEEYCAITSASLDREVTRQIGGARSARVVTAAARDVGAASVTLEDGSQLHAELVIDARGPGAGRAVTATGYQKFLGLELEVAPGSGPACPILMDATVQQRDGFRFMYVLPLAEDRVLVEDTYYSTNPGLDEGALRERILEYARDAGMSVRGVLREERGVLPIPTELDLGAEAAGPIRAGYAGGLFHPTTGYSLPVAMRFALHVSSRPAAEVLGARYVEWRKQHQKQARFCLALNRLLFRAFAPEERYHVLERFYRLPVATIRRFYALDTTAADRARILCGRPPVGFSLRRLMTKGHADE